MKALVYHGPRDLRLENVRDLSIDDGEVLVKVKACGICGSDVHGYMGVTGRRLPPMIMGHEFSGEIESINCKHSNFNVGDKVIVQPIEYCNDCEKCNIGQTHMCINKRSYGVLDTNGAFAEYILVPERVLYKMPSTMSFSEGAIVEAFAVAYCGVKKSGDLNGKNVLIVGAGTIGQLILEVVKAQNPKSITVSDLSNTRLETAKKFGADYIINPSEEEFISAAKNNLCGDFFDVAIEAVGVTPTVKQSLALLNNGGIAIWIGNSAKNIEINMQDVVTKEYKIFGSFIYTHEQFGEAIKYIEEKNIDLSKFISKEIPIEEGPKMFKILETETEKYLKVIIKF